MTVVSVPPNALSITLAHPGYDAEVLHALHLITGRSLATLMSTLRSSEPVCIAALYGNDHLQEVERLERTVEYLDGRGIEYLVHEWVDGQGEGISIDVMQQIVEAAEGQYS